MNDVAPPLADLALDWCHVKSITAASTSGNSDRARRSDLARWARAIRASAGDELDDAGQLDIETDLAPVSYTHLTLPTKA